MIITHPGHAKFVITLDSGLTIITDPYDAACGYPMEVIPADAVLVSHHHHDHDAVETIGGHPQVIDTPGTHTLTAGVTVTAVEACHDDAQGAKRGKTLLFRLDAEGLRVIHLGDLGHVLTAEQVQALGNADVLMIPVGGFYTIDAKTAQQVAEQLHARVIVPMHYRTAANADWPIATAADFLSLYPGEHPAMPLLRVEKEDLVCQPRLARIETA